MFIYGKTNKNSYFKYCCIYKFVAVFIFLEKGYKVDNIIIKEASKGCFGENRIFKEDRSRDG
ncbi:hypothetical protein HMPREF1140_1120 [Lachnoanaerobaculum sp. ICM7]|nr:hypothetical protein HMPREF1140_1120 [Lachnoanaerobaculum sp. ICM7]